MRVEYETSANGGRLILSGELDHHAANSAMRRIKALLGEHQPGNLELVMEKVGFMDSSGIALMLNVQKMQQQIGGKLRVSKLSPQAKKVVQLVGLQKMIDIEE